MYRLKVAFPFCDKLTGKTHKRGDVFEAADERAAELLKHPSGLVEVVEHVEGKATTPAATVKTTAAKKPAAAKRRSTRAKKEVSENGKEN